MCARIRQLAMERPWFGYRRPHVLLRREGWAENQKRGQRVYREEGLGVRQKGKRRRSQVSRPLRAPMGRADERWSMNFVADTLSSGRRFG